jgi:hypothetical protein
VLSGWIVLGAAVLIAAMLFATVLRARRLRARLPHPPAGSVVFLASVMADDATWLRGHGRLGIAVSDREGIEVRRGRPLEAEWAAAWDAVEALGTGLVAVGRQLAPVIHVRLTDGTSARLLLRGDHGVYPSPDYATALLEELEALRPPTPDAGPAV